MTACLKVESMNLKLQKRKDGVWLIVAVDNGAVLASRRWPTTQQAVRWCRAILSSYRDNYSLEISDE